MAGSSAELPDLVSQRGTEQLTHRGHIFIKEKTSSDKLRQFWRCRFVETCEVRVHTWISTGEIAKISGVHGDELNPAVVEVSKHQTGLKRRAAETQEIPLQLIENVFQHSTHAAKLILPSCKTLSRDAKKARKKARRPPAIPENRSSIQIPLEYATYESEPGTCE